MESNDDALGEEKPARFTILRTSTLYLSIIFMIANILSPERHKLGQDKSEQILKERRAKNSKKYDMKNDTVAIYPLKEITGEGFLK